MKYSAIYHKKIKKDLKNLDKPLITKIKNYLHDICKNPYIGNQLKGFEFDTFSFHFHYSKNQYRIAYQVLDNKIYFLKIASRQNFYDNIKNRI
jgi:mRNA-degrading endonuclease RelE of RelBE toxin-antitoxin system